jgi:hypothetical protein
MRRALGLLAVAAVACAYAWPLQVTLAFAAFWVLWRERERPRLALVAAAGVLAGLTVVVELPAVGIGAILAVYAAVGGPAVRGLAVYGGGATSIAGISGWYAIAPLFNAVGAAAVLAVLSMSRQGLAVADAVLALAGAGGWVPR